MSFAPFSRRSFVRGAAATVVATMVGRAADPVQFRVRRELFLKSPAPGTTVLASSYYTHREGQELLGRFSYMTRSDTSDHTFVRFSPDNGRTWREEREVRHTAQRAEGMFRRSVSCTLVEPGSGELLEFRIEGVFPDDKPLARLRGWCITYAISADGGRSFRFEGPVVHRGAEFSPSHPLPGVWQGKNCAYIGDATCVPLALPDGTILVPIQVAPLGEDGHLYNPAGGYTYTEAAVLRGRWNTQTPPTLEWEMSSRVAAHPALSTRGMIEPTLARLADGRLLMVLRGSNEKKTGVFAGRWVAFSSNEGRTWTEAKLWTYTDGTPFHSPSACSLLLAHSSGRLFWLGNLTPDNPDGNRPRYPLVIGEVDRASCLLRKETVTTIDDREPGESELLSLSNFYAREDRETREIVLHMSRQGAKSAGKKYDFTSDAFLYRIAVE